MRGLASSLGQGMGQVDDRHGRVRAVIHRRILDVAESQPTASVEELAEEVSGATEDFVEQVLDEYGDPGTESDDATATASDPAPNGDTDSQAESSTGDTQQPAETGEEFMTGSESATPEESTTKQNGETPSPTVDLTDKQRRALRVLRKNPEASQADVASELDVTRATISRWLNDIPGFEWDDRRRFLESLSDDTLEPHRDDIADRVAALEDRIADLEAALEDEYPGDDGLQPALSADLAHRVVHACMVSERISVDEELALLEAIIQSD